MKDTARITLADLADRLHIVSYQGKRWWGSHFFLMRGEPPAYIARLLIPLDISKATGVQTYFHGMLYDTRVRVMKQGRRPAWPEGRTVTRIGSRWYQTNLVLWVEKHFPGATWWERRLADRTELAAMVDGEVVAVLAPAHRSAMKEKADGVADDDHVDSADCTAGSEDWGHDAREVE